MPSTNITRNLLVMSDILTNLLPQVDLTFQASQSGSGGLTSRLFQ